MKDVRLNKNTRERDYIIIITTVFERALPGTNLTETTNNRLPSRTTDTECLNQIIRIQNDYN